MSDPLRVGVIGCGAIATAVHLRVLRHLRDVRVVAVADPAAEARARGQAICRGAAALDNADALLARRDVDAVVVTAPSGLHAGIGMSALASGRHLYLEKPLATSIDDGRRVAEAARASGVVACIGFNWRFQPLIARAHVLVRAGTIGALRSVTTRFCERADVPGWKARRSEGGGALLDLGSHHFDLIRWFVGSEVRRVEASIRSEASEQDSASVRLELDGGVTATSFFSLREGPSHALELVGERGVMRIDRYARTLTFDGVQARAMTWDTLAWRARSVIRPRAEPSWGFALRAFVDAVRGRRVELPTFEDGLRSLEVVAEAERVARAG